MHFLRRLLAIDGRFSHANMVAHLKAIIKEDEHGLIASSREKRHPKLYCPEWHKLVLVSALRQSHSLVRVVYSCSQSAGARSNMADDSRRQAATVVR